MLKGLAERRALQSRRKQNSIDRSPNDQTESGHF